MRTHEERQFRIPIDELRLILKKQHGVDLAGVEPFLDRDQLVFAIQRGPAAQASGLDVPPPGLKPDLPPVHSRRRNRRRRRNRIKTRGWKVLARITNSQGLSANVYEPFVHELRDTEGTRAEQRAIVRSIMEKNGNTPSAESIDYYLDNTLEYLRKSFQSGGSSQ